MRIRRTRNRQDVGSGCYRTCPNRMSGDHRVSNQESRNTPIFRELLWLKAVTIPDSDCIPRVDQCIDSLCDATTSSILIDNRSYWQVEFADKDRDKTGFASHHGLSRSVPMTPRQKCSLDTFQHVIDIILYSVQCQFALVSFDDIVIFPTSSDEHTGQVRHGLTLLNDAVVEPTLK